MPPGSHSVALSSLMLIFYVSTEGGRRIQASGRFGTHETPEKLVAALN